MLCALAVAGAFQPVLASAEPTSSPTASASGTGSAATDPVQPSPSTRTSYRHQDSPFSVTVSPARLTVAADALDRTQQLTVVNQGEQTVSLTVQKRNFVAAPDGGLSYRPDAPYGAADWVDVQPTSLTLEPGTSQQVRATFDVPAEPEPGDHQVALVFLAPPAGSGNVKVNRGIGTPLYVTVPGPVDDSVRLDGLTGPGWSLRGRPTLTVRMSSTGTVHRDFRGATALGVGTPDHPSRFADFTVSRGADRVVSTSWDPPLLCVCRPSVTVVNAGQPPQTVSTRVVVLPWWALAGVVLVVVVGAALLVRRRSYRGGSTPGSRAVAPAEGSG